MTECDMYDIRAGSNEYWGTTNFSHNGMVCDGNILVTRPSRKVTATSVSGSVSKSLLHWSGSVVVTLSDYGTVLSRS